MQIKQKKDTEAAFVSNKETADFLLDFSCSYPGKTFGDMWHKFLWTRCPPVTQPIVSVQTPITDFSGAK